ncbi:MAG TPA: hypothetical protein VHO25_15680, partial [Polyangiaceae bacterium]|nr:hypothetical protein [Polyangiaceae bacterium]
MTQSMFVDPMNKAQSGQQAPQGTGSTETSAASPDSATSTSTGPASTRSGKKSRSSKAKGLTIDRRYAQTDTPFEEIVWERRSSQITNPDGSVVFKMEGAEIPAQWSQLATDIVVSKYFRKAGIRGDKAVGETSVRQVVYRIAHTIR